MSDEREGLRERIARELWGSDRGRFWPPANDLARDVYLERADRILALLPQAQEPVAWLVQARLPETCAEDEWPFGIIVESEGSVRSEVSGYKVRGYEARVIPLVPLYASPVASAPEEEREAEAHSVLDALGVPRGEADDMQERTFTLAERIREFWPRVASSVGGSDGLTPQPTTRANPAGGASPVASAPTLYWPTDPMHPCPTCGARASAPEEEREAACACLEGPVTEVVWHPKRPDGTEARCPICAAEMRHLGYMSRPLRATPTEPETEDRDAPEPGDER